MPKRANEQTLKFIVDKLKKLEKEVDRSRRDRRNCFPLSSSSSSSSRSDSSSCSSKNSSPTPENLDGQEDNLNPVAINPPAVDKLVTIESDKPPTSSDIFTPTENEGLDIEITEILGADPSKTVDYGPDINKDVACRFSHIATSGLSKEERKELVDKFLVPNNCTTITAPLLNVEVKAAVADLVLKRDKAIKARQKQLAAGLSLLGKIISDQLHVKEKNHCLIKELMDIGRIFCDIQHSESIARRNFTLYSVKKDLRDQLATTKIDKYLFGNDFAESIKTAKTVSKCSSDLKQYTMTRPKPSTSNKTNRHLNWKARIPTHRQVRGPPPHQQSPATRNVQPRRTPSQALSQRHKNSRHQ